MIRASHIITVMVGLLILPGVVWGFDTEASRETLRGIKGVWVAIEDINPEIERDGLTKKQIQTDVELKIRLAGLNVLERLKAPGRPWLYVGVNVFRTSLGPYVYVVDVELWQDVYIERNSKRSVALTWSTNYFGITSDLNPIRNEIKDRVDIFLNAWLSVNPK